MDDKIRQYVLKKEQQRKRARELRESRKSETYLNKKSQSSFDLLKKQSRRVIGDPFDSKKSNVFRGDELSDPTNKSSMSSKNVWNNDTNINNDFNNDLNSYSNNNNTWQSNNSYSQSRNNRNRDNNRYDRSDRITFNKENWASQEDVKQVRGLVSQLQGQMHNLQYQIDTLKYENQRLKDKIGYLEEQFINSNNSENLRSERMERPLQQRSRYENGNKNHGRRTMSSRSHTQSLQNSRDTSPRQSHSMQNKFDNNKNMFDNFKSNKKPENMDIDTPVGPNSRTKSRFNKSKSMNNVSFDGFDSENDNGINNNMTLRRNNNHNLNNGNDRNRFNNNNNNNKNNNSSRNLHRNNRMNSNNNNFEDNKFNGFSGFNNMTRNNGGNNNNNINKNTNNDNTNRGRSPEPMQMDDNVEGEEWNPPRSTAEDLIRNLPPDAFQSQEERRVLCQICGRKFNPQALSKHSKVCKKVFVNKRKQFDTSKQRLDEEAKKLQQNQRRNNRHGVNKIHNNNNNNNNSKSSKWKNQSNFLRQAIKAAKEVSLAQKQGKDISKLPMPSMPSMPDDRIPCEYCGRKFSAVAASRHIPKCKNIKSRPKPLRRKR